MSGASLDVEPYPLDYLVRRLQQVKDLSPKLYEARDPNKQGLLRIVDIAAYIGIRKEYLYRIEHWRTYQRELSWFFSLWDSGQLVKGQVDGKWQIVRHSALAQMATPQGASTAPRARLDMRVEVTPTGVKLKGR